LVTRIGTRLSVPHPREFNQPAAAPASLGARKKISSRLFLFKR
jgi:hypothetical protein